MPRQTAAATDEMPRWPAELRLPRSGCASSVGQRSAITTPLSTGRKNTFTRASRSWAWMMYCTLQPWIRICARGACACSDRPEGRKHGAVESDLVAMPFRALRPLSFLLVTRRHQLSSGNTTAWAGSCGSCPMRLTLPRCAPPSSRPRFPPDTASSALQELVARLDPDQGRGLVGQALGDRARPRARRFGR